jgi:serine/threonine protein kinase
METEMGQWSGWRGERMDQVAIKEMGISCFKKILLLGRGAFGEVYLAENAAEESK